MNKDRRTTFEKIKAMPAGELIDLSHEELSELIAEAKAAIRDSRLAVEWLRAVKFEKTIRDEARSSEQDAASKGEDR